MTLQHQMLAIDEGAQRLHLVDTGAAAAIWSLDLDEYPLARDMQRIAADRVLIGHDRGFLELEIATGRCLRDCSRWRDVTAVHRLPNGHTLLTGLDLDGAGGVTVLTLDAQAQVVASARRAGDYVRLMRVTAAGTYLLCTNDRIVETDSALRLLREFRADGFEHAWMAERLADGSTLVSAGYGAFMARFNARGELLGSFGHAADLPAEIAPHFYAAFQLLRNGHLVVANWAGHGPANGGQGRQLLEFDAEGRLVGAWSNPALISSLQGLLILQ